MIENADNSGCVQITHYINPHMFWYRILTDLCPNPNPKFLQLENKIQEYYLNSSLEKPHVPELNEVVAVFNFPRNRWIRAKIDHIAEYFTSPTRYIFWAIDHGLPMQTDGRWIRKLPKEFAEIDNTTIRFGGISNIVPAEKVFSFVNNCAELVTSNNWSPLAVKTIQDLIDDAASVIFIPELHHNSNQYFGNLEIVTHANKSIKANIVLLEINHAKNEADFLKIIRGIGTNKISRWKNNDGNCVILKQDINKFSTDSMNYSSLQKDFTKGSVSSANQELDLKVKKKISDWDCRNIKSFHEEVVTIDDEIFDESASVRCNFNQNALDQPNATSINVLQINDESDSDDVQLYNVAGTSRMKRSQRYKKNLPRPPKIQGLTLIDDNINAQPKSEGSDLTEEKDEVPEKILQEAQLSDEHSNVSGNSGMKGRTTLIERLANKKKSIQNKVINDKTISSIPNAIPAGFDLRNLQPTKYTKELNNSNNRKIANEMSNLKLSDTNPYSF